MERYVIRLLLRSRPDAPAGALETILRSQPDVEVVGEPTDPLGVLVAVRETNADALVLELEQREEAGVLSHLLAEFPDLTVLTLLPSGEAFIEQRCAHRWSVDDLSPGGLLEALRRAVRAPCECV
jgi:DNA-binding NarL/FixJ family response regulator